MIKNFLRVLVNLDKLKKDLILFLTWFKTTQPLLKPINAKFVLSKLILSRHHSKSIGSGVGLVVAVHGGVWRSGDCSKSDVKSEEIGMVGSELHESSLHAKLIWSFSGVVLSWTCSISMCISSVSTFACGSNQ